MMSEIIIYAPEGWFFELERSLATGKNTEPQRTKPPSSIERGLGAG